MGNTGLFIIRIIYGTYFAYHGFPKLFSNPETWESLGGVLAPLGITFFPVVIGFLLAAIECIGGLCFALGFFFKGASFALFLRAFLFFILAFLNHPGAEELLSSLLFPSVFLGLFLLGEGKYALSHWIR